MAALITNISATNNVVSAALTSADGFRAFYPVTVEGISETFDGVHTLTGIDGLTATWAQIVDDTDDDECLGQMSVNVTWITATDVENFLGFVPTSEGDIDFLDTCTAAANAWAFRKRLEAGYIDHPSIVPDSAAKDGTVLYAAISFRERGSIDTYQQADAYGMPSTPTGTISQCLGKLGLNRPVIS